MKNWQRAVLTSLVGRVAPALLSFGRAGRLRILNYHRINHAHPDSLIDHNVISASPEVFDRQMRFCKQHFDVISFTELETALDGGLQLPRKPLIITFDDGYEDNYRFAFPILRAHGLTATFCICVETIGTDRLFWWDEVAYCLYTHPHDRLTIDIGGQPLALPLATRAAREAAVKTVLQALKTVPNAERRRALDRLTRLANPRSVRPIERQSMTWDEIRALVAGGMTIASHSMTHPVLSRIEDAEELRYEVESSKAVLEAQTGTPVRVFSYPVGGAATFNPRVQAAVKAAGYRFALSYMRGTNTIGPHLDCYGMRRLHVDGLNAEQFTIHLAWAH